MNLIGNSSPTFCHEPVERTAAKVAKAGFDLWEVVGEGLHSPWERRAEIQDAASRYGLKLQLHAPLSDCNVGSLIPAVWEQSVLRVEQALRGAAAIGIKRVTVHPGNHSPLSRGHYPELHEATRRAVSRLDRLGQDLGLELCLENMATGWAFETDSLKKLVDLVRRTEFKLCFDLGHAHVAKKLREFEGARRWIANVHVHDNSGLVDEHLTLGEGTLPWQRVVKKLLAKGYRETFVIESRSHASGAESLGRLRKHMTRVG